MSAGPWRVAATSWAIIIVAMGTVPTQGAVHAVSQGHDDLTTTLGHFAAYGILGFLLVVAMGGWEARLWTACWALVLATALGICVEIVQAPLAYRDAQVADAVVNAAGAAVGLLVFSVVARGRRL